jgi:O-antigen/teichoic acid export membrane protein
MRIPSISGFDQQALEKYFANTGWLFMARVGSLVIKMLMGIAVANYLGKGAYGLLNYTSSFVAFFIAIAGLGLDTFLTRELASHPARQAKLLGTAFRMRLLSGLVILPLIWAIYLLLTNYIRINVSVEFLLIVGCTGLAQSLNIIDCYFQSKVQGKYVMYVQVSGNILSALFKLLLILIQAPISWFIYSLLLDAMLLGIGYALAYLSRGHSFTGWQFEAGLAQQLLKKSWPLALSALLVSLYMKIDQLMLGSMLGESALGIYSTVATLSESWYFIPIAIVTSVFPALMNARRDDPVRYQKRLQNMYDLMVGISISIALVMSFASDLIYELFYKPEYWSGADILVIHIWAGVFVFLGTASSQYLVAEGYTHLSLLRTCFGAIVNIVLNIFWIPEYGIAGAAYATLIAYAGATFFILFIPSTRRQGFMMLKSLFLVSLIQKVFSK